MTEPAAPLTHTGLPHRSTLALFGVLLAYVVFNAAASWTTTESETLAVMLFAFLVFQPVVFGVWTALGQGSFLTRLSIAVPCLLILFVAPGCMPEQFADIDRRDFIAAVEAGYAIFAASIVLFLIFRRVTGFRIRPLEYDSRDNESGLRFSIKHLMALITIYAIALGMATHLKLRDGPPSSGIFGPNFFIGILIQGSILYLVNVLPTLTVPLLILHGRPSKRAILVSLAFWAIVTTILVAIIIGLGDMLFSDIFDLLSLILAAQFGVVVAGVLTALPLRLAGLRLVRLQKQSPNRLESST